MSNEFKGGEDFFNEIEEDGALLEEQQRKFANAPSHAVEVKLDFDPRSLTTEQLIERSNQISSRIQRQATSKGILPMPAPEEINKMYEDQLENSRALHVYPPIWSTLIEKLTGGYSSKPSFVKYVLYKFFKLIGIYNLIMKLPNKKKN